MFIDFLHFSTHTHTPQMALLGLKIAVCCFLSPHWWCLDEVIIGKTFTTCLSAALWLSGFAYSLRSGHKILQPASCWWKSVWAKGMMYSYESLRTKWRFFSLHFFTLLRHTSVHHHSKMKPLQQRFFLDMVSRGPTIRGGTPDYFAPELIATRLPLKFRTHCFV